MPRLAAKALAAGHRVAIRSLDAARLARLDETLWTYDALSFLPHAQDTHPRAADQPCLLTAADPPANTATVLIALDGDLPAHGFDRILYVFDDVGRDAARARWRALTGPGTYWQQAERGWTRAAERPAQA